MRSPASAHLLVQATPGMVAVDDATDYEVDEMEVEIEEECLKVLALMRPKMQFMW